MHYKNGREVKIGDKVVGRNWSGNPVSGIVVAVNPNAGETSCNLGVVNIESVAPNMCAKEFLHIDDALPYTK